MSYLKKFNLNFLYSFIVILLSVLIFFLLNYYRHWTSFLDQEFTLIYNSLLLNSGIKAEFFWHPGHSIILLTSLWLDFLNLINIVDFSDFNSVKKNPNSIKDIIFFGRFVNLIILFLFTFLIVKTFRLFSSNNFYIFVFSLLFLISASVVFSISQVRTEFLSALMIYACLYCLLKFVKTKKSFRKYILLSGFFFILSIFSKFQSIFIFFFFPLLLFLFCKKKKIEFKSYDFEKKKYFNLSLLILVFPIIIIWLKYSSGINIYFVPLSFLYFALFVKFIIWHYPSNDSYYFKFIFYFFLGAVVSFFLLFILRPFNTNNINVILNSFGMTSMFVKGTNPYEFSFINLKSLIYESFLGFIYYIKIIFYNFKVESYLFIFSIFLNFYLFQGQKKRYLYSLLILSFILFSIIFLFSSRPMPQYVIYFAPIILIYSFNVFVKIKNKVLPKFFIIIIFLVGFFETHSFVKSNMFSENKSNTCSEANIISEYTYMRQWHNKIDEVFISSICKND